MHEQFSLEPTVAEVQAIRTLRALLARTSSLPPTEAFEMVVSDTPLMQMLDRYLSRDDNALFIDVVAEFGAVRNLPAGRLISASVVLADKLFMEPMFMRLRLCAVQADFMDAPLAFDERNNIVKGRMRLRREARMADSIIASTRGTTSRVPGVTALPLQPAVRDRLAFDSVRFATLDIENRPTSYRKLNPSAFRKAVKEVTVYDYALALGELRSALSAMITGTSRRMLFGKPFHQHQFSQDRIARAVVDIESLRLLAIRQFSEFSTLATLQPAICRTARRLAFRSMTGLSHMMGAESVVQRSDHAFLATLVDIMERFHVAEA